MFKKSVILLISLFITTFISGCGDSSSDDKITFTLLQTTDVHHRAAGSGASVTYSPTDGIDSSDTDDLTTGGYARLAAKIADIRNAKENKNILLVDSGDFLMGTVYDLSLYTKVPSTAFAFMEAIKYDAITLGNHEFDLGPEMLAGFINNARGENGATFSVPIIASNMITDKAEGTDDDGIEALVAAGAIKGVEIKTLDNGLKVGMIGIMGADADSKAPLAYPVEFTNNMADPNEIAVLQAMVSDLRDEVDIVIAISHSGVSNTDPENPEGDDVTIAQNISGIDIIASGHDHATTESVLEIENDDHTTYIICAGHYGKNLAQLDVTYKQDTGITAVNLTNHPINDSTEGDATTQYIISGYEAAINEVLTLSDLAVNQVIGTTDSDNIGKSHHAAEAGIGNLIADSLRYCALPVNAGSDTPTLGVVANGVVRNGFEKGQQISFADLYSVLPLGMTLAPTQNSMPGYPLVQVYLTGDEIKNMCQLISYVIAADDKSFVDSLPTLYDTYTQLQKDATELATALSSGTPDDLRAYNGIVLPQVGTPTADKAIEAFKAVGSEDSAACQAAAAVYAYAAQQAGFASLLCSKNGLQYILPMLGTDFFLHTSGAQFTHTGSEGLYQINRDSVKMYPKTDIQCQTTPEPVNGAALYPVVVDIYVVLMMKIPEFIFMLEQLGIPVEPTTADGTTVVTTANLMGQLIGGTEVTGWQALLKYLASPANKLGLEGIIPDSSYGKEAINTGDSSRINQP